MVYTTYLWWWPGDGFWHCFTHITPKHNCHENSPSKGPNVHYSHLDMMPARRRRDPISVLRNMVKGREMMGLDMVKHTILKGTTGGSGLIALGATSSTWNRIPTLEDSFPPDGKKTGGAVPGRSAWYLVGVICQLLEVLTIVLLIWRLP